MQDLAGHHKAIQTHCERARRTVPCFTQATMELDGTDSSHFAEMNMGCLQGSR